MTRPRLVDLFCKAGGATKGYQRAGFYVIGVDIEPQPNYCGDEFIQADAMELFSDLADRRWRLSTPMPDAIHASPPCHDHSNVTGKNRKADGVKGTGWMLDATLVALAGVRMPWVVENVETAKFSLPGVYRIKLCGSSFGLDVQRHRWFATNVLTMQPQCQHYLQKPRFRSLDSRRGPGALARVVGVHGHLNYAGEFDLRCKAMGIDWMTNDELSQAIPPAYTEYIGRQLLDALALTT